jgi:hypothetical protein
MRFIATALVCAGVLLTAAACDPVTERKYFTEGAGIDLYTSDRASQTELLKQYINFVCGQAGPDCGGNWTTFVQAGMNDIDLRCDVFLTWLDARRRDKEPVLEEISMLNTTTNTVMAAAGASSKSLQIATAAFGLATATYTNWNSRLLISVNQSTVQTIVYTRQQDYRSTISSYIVPDQPTAIYLLRNYLRICLPTSIEADVNTTPTLVQRGNPADAKNNPVIKPIVHMKMPPAALIKTSFSLNDATKALRAWLRPNGVPSADHAKTLDDFLVQKQFNPKPLVGTFLIGAQFSDARTEFARQQGLIP